MINIKCWLNGRPLHSRALISLIFLIMWGWGRGIYAHVSKGTCTWSVQKRTSESLDWSHSHNIKYLLLCGLQVLWIYSLEWYILVVIALFLLFWDGFIHISVRAAQIYFWEIYILTSIKYGFHFFSTFFSSIHYHLSSWW